MSISSLTYGTSKMSSMWREFLSAPGYTEHSPWFPNPLVCTRDIIHSGITEAYGRLVPWNGIGVWLKETRRLVYDTWYWDASSLLIHPLLLALFLTAARLLLDKVLFKPIAEWFELTKESARKFPESVWKCLVYSITWIWAGCIICFSKENYFFYLQSHWNTWYPGQPVEPAIYWLYMIQLGFYLHSVYATAFLETIRKDFAIMMLHHIQSLALLAFSYCVRFHIIGLVFLFFLDIGDIWLEMSKMLFYFKNRGGKERWAPRLASAVCFGIFAIEFALFRIYWFPTKVIYSGMCIGPVLIPGVPYYFLFIPLLWLNFSIQSYWFVYILKMLWRIVKGEIDKGDTREYEETNGHIHKRLGGADHNSNENGQSYHKKKE